MWTLYNNIQVNPGSVLAKQFIIKNILFILLDYLSLLSNNAYGMCEQEYVADKHTNSHPSQKIHEDTDAP